MDNGTFMDDFWCIMEFIKLGDRGDILILLYDFHRRELLPRLYSSEELEKCNGNLVSCYKLSDFLNSYFQYRACEILKRYLANEKMLNEIYFLHRIVYKLYKVSYIIPHMRTGKYEPIAVILACMINNYNFAIGKIDTISPRYLVDRAEVLPLRYQTGRYPRSLLTSRSGSKPSLRYSSPLVPISGSVSSRPRFHSPLIHQDNLTSSLRASSRTGVINRLLSDIRSRRYGVPLGSKHFKTAWIESVRNFEVNMGAQPYFAIEYIKDLCSDIT